MQGYVFARGWWQNGDATREPCRHRLAGDREARPAERARMVRRPSRCAHSARGGCCAAGAWHRDLQQAEAAKVEEQGVCCARSRKSRRRPSRRRCPRRRTASRSPACDLLDLLHTRSTRFKVLTFYSCRHGRLVRSNQVRLGDSNQVGIYYAGTIVHPTFRVYHPTLKLIKFLDHLHR
mgnify:CR=1 FL=1